MVKGLNDFKLILFNHARASFVFIYFSFIAIAKR